MLQRQRQLRAQQQQVRRASSNQLPASGGSSGNSRQARAQRANTTRAQAANNQRVINRGIEGFIRRGNAQDKLDKAAQGTRGSGTRTAGAGGGLARRPSSAVTPANRSQGGAAASTRVQPVRVRDVTNSSQLNGTRPTQQQLSAAQQGPQPATRRQQAQAKADAAARGSTGPNRVGQPAGSANRVYGANRVNAAVSKAVRATKLSNTLKAAGGLAGAALTAAAIPLEIKNMVDRQTQYNREAERRNRVNETGRASKVQSDGRYIPPNQQVVISRPAAKPKPPTRSSGGNPPAPGSTRRQPSSGGGSSTPSRPSRPSSPQTSTGTAGKGRSWDEFNPNRGTSQTNNPLIKNDSWMTGRMKDREAAQQSSDAQKIGNKFDTKSDLITPTTKVDGSNLDTKKIDQKKVDEYKRRKNRYYD